MSTGDEDVRILESVVYFVDPKSPGSLGFLDGKERIRITLKKEHHSLDTFRRHIVEYAGLKAKAEKRGSGNSADSILNKSNHVLSVCFINFRET